MKPLTPSVRHTHSRVAAFQRSLFPARSLLPERFRGPVAPSAAGGGPRSPAPGGWDGGTLPESAGCFKEGFEACGRMMFGWRAEWGMVRA